MKKYFLGFIILITCLVVPIVATSASAENTEAIQVHSDQDLSADPGDEITIPIYMEDNTGIAGYVLQFDYDADILTPVSVTRGTVLQEGNFNDDIGGSTANLGTLKVMWNHDKAVSENGKIFSCTFKVAENANSSLMIHLTNEVSDTYDGNLQNLKMECTNIPIKITEAPVLTKVDAKEATCTEEGNLEYYVAVIDGIEKYYADEAGGNEIERNSWKLPAVGHNWDSGTVTKEATEKEDGMMTYTCQNDPSHVRTEIIPKLSHIHKSVRVQAKDATCTTAGNKEYFICEGCGLLYEDEACTKQIRSEDTVIAATGHIPEIIPAEAATCTEAGASEGITCSVCGKIFKEPSIIAALGHNYGNPVYSWSEDNTSVTAAMTCENDSTHVITETVKTTSQTLKEATKESAGSKKYTAEFTNDSFTKQEKEVVIPAIEKTDEEKAAEAKAQEDQKTAEVAAQKAAEAKQKETDAKTPTGAGATATAANKAIISMKSDGDTKNSKFALLQLKSTSQTKNSVKITYKKLASAKKYVIYGNQCGNNNKWKKLTTTTKTTLTYKKIAGKKVKAGTYYKFMVVALDKNNKVVSTSKTIHVATKGGKVGNVKSVSTKAKKNKVSLKVKNTFKLAATQTPVSKILQVKKHRAIAYESSNTKIATVNSKGVITAKKKGTCSIFVYAQNGVMKIINVTVK